MMLTRRTCLTALLSPTLPAMTSLQAQSHDPRTAREVVDEQWQDTAREREVPVKLRWPDASVHPGTRPVIVFSHGLGGTREGGAVWGEAWVAAGFVVVHLQHPGSDLVALRNAAASFTDKASLRKAASPQQLLARLRDVGFALDEIQKRHAAQQGRWGSVRAAQIGMCGHSFGAHTTLGMAGQHYGGFAGINEPRLAAFIAFSPSVPVLGDPVRAFAALTRPLLCVTGTRDSDVAGVGSTPDKRMAVFGALPKGHKAHLVLNEADHMTFGGQTGRAVEIVPREPITRDLQGTHHSLVAAISTDWWRSTLLNDALATARLMTPFGLATGDVWQQG